jgi:hypothetical protein
MDRRHEDVEAAVPRLHAERGANDAFRGVTGARRDLFDHGRSQRTGPTIRNGGSKRTRPTITTGGSDKTRPTITFA